MKSVRNFLRAWRSILVFAAALSYVGVAFAQNVYAPIDPCNLFQRSNITIPIAIATSSPAVTQLIAAPTTGKIWICDMVIIPASSSSVELQTGTGTACATGTANLTGAINAQVSRGDAGVPPLVTGTTVGLCANVTGTGGQGYITYITPGF